MTVRRKRPRELTFKQRRFVDEYIRNKGNGVQAALKAYETKDYTTTNQISRRSSGSTPGSNRQAY